MVLKGKVLKIAYGVHVLGSLWHLWADFWWPRLCVISDLIHLLIPSITCGFHALYSQNHLYPPDNHWEYLWTVPGVSIHLQGLTCASMAGWPSCGFYTC